MSLTTMTGGSEPLTQEICHAVNPMPLASKIKSVEGKLWETCRALAGTEGNIYLFSTLKSLGLATNDVKHFVEKQTIHKKADKKVDVKLMKSAMQCKLKDACAHAKRLRQDKNCLRNKVFSKYRNSGTQAKKIVNDIIIRYRNLKKTELGKAKKKVNF